MVDGSGDHLRLGFRGDDQYSTTVSHAPPRIRDLGFNWYDTLYNKYFGSLPQLSWRW